MTRLAMVLLAALVLSGPGKTSPQDSAVPEEDFRVYQDAPRLFLEPRRLRLLKRERERKSMRWMQFEALVRGGAPLAEPGFAFALYHAVTADRSAGEKALAWASSGTDVHQLALVFDWCQDILTEARRRELAARILQLSRQATRQDVATMRDRVLAAIAVADQDQAGSEKVLGDVVRQWWRGSIAPRLVTGAVVIAHADLYPLEEMLHAIRDNLRIDLRENAGDYFTRLTLYELASYYPAPFQAGDTDYRVPAFTGAGEPDMKRAAISRAAELSLVAYDTNARENQYVQGWLMQDRFQLRDAFGAPYEFLWGNPYQPGLSYMQLPLSYYDPVLGALFLRSSWEEDASWFGLVGPEMQLFENGRVRVLDPRAPRSEAARPVELGDAEVVLGRSRLSFTSTGETAYVVGLVPLRPYLAEIDDEEMQEFETDRRGTLELHFPKNRKLQVLIHESR